MGWLDLPIVPPAEVFDLSQVGNRPPAEGRDNPGTIVPLSGQERNKLMTSATKALMLTPAPNDIGAYAI